MANKIEPKIGQVGYTLRPSTRRTKPRHMWPWLEARRAEAVRRLRDNGCKCPEPWIVFGVCKLCGTTQGTDGTAHE